MVPDSVVVKIPFREEPTFRISVLPVTTIRTLVLVFQSVAEKIPLFRVKGRENSFNSKEKGLPGVTENEPSTEREKLLLSGRSCIAIVTRSP